jgi:tetratricopeptide (TPR) repeat protein
MAQLAGLASYINGHLAVDMTAPVPEVIAGLQRLAQGRDADVRAVALMTLHVGFEDRAGVREFLDNQLALLGASERAIRLRWAKTAFYVANAFAQSGNFGQAILAYQKSLLMHPDQVPVLSNLALAHLQSGEGQRAVDTLQRALQSAPCKGILYFQLAKTHRRLGRIPEAIRALERGLELEPDHPQERQLLRELRGR